MGNENEDDSNGPPRFRAVAFEADDRMYPMPSGRRAHSPRTLAKRVTEACVVVCLTLFCVSLWNKAAAPKESPIAPAMDSPFTLLVDQGEKFLVLPLDLTLDPSTPHRQCEGVKGKVPCFKLVPAKPSK